MLNNKIMNYELKAQIHKAIQNVLDKNAENDMWNQYIDDELVDKMTEAAALVFDASMDGQDFYEKDIHNI